jgi:hypothetical protein
MEPFERGNVAAELVAYFFIAMTCLAIFALVPYLLLWFAGIGNPYRPDQMLVIYSAVWSAAAIGAAIYNIRMVIRVIKGRGIKSLLKVLAVSLVCVASCPEWFY